MITDVEYSIIVPVYNVEKYIEKCLKSIYAQKERRYEVIIVNDGTVDNSREIIVEKCLFDSRFKLIDKENGGLSSARNEGLKHAVGRYIIFIDSDDWIEEDYLEQLTRTIDEQADVVVCGYKLDDSVIHTTYIPYANAGINKLYSLKDKDKEIFEKHICSYPRKGYEVKDTLMPVWKNVYRREFIERYHLSFMSERKVMAEDYLFNMQAYYYADTVQVVGIYGYVHLIVPGSLSRRYRENAFDMSIAKHNYVMNFFKKNNLINNQKLIDAEMANFAFSVAIDMRNLCVSEKKEKFKLITKTLKRTEIIELLKYNQVYNLQFNLRLAVCILYTKTPIIYIVAYNVFDRFQYLYRLIQKKRVVGNKAFIMGD